MRIDWHCVCGDAEASHSSRSDGEHCHGHCQKTERDCNGKGYRPIMHTARPAAFTAILHEAETRFLPKAYTCDLSTDYQSIWGYEGRFVWALRTNGTEFYRLDHQTRRDYEGSKVGLDYWTDPTQGHADTLVFFWDGTTLSEITREAGLGMLQASAERQSESHNCHGPHWHDRSCTHRKVSVAPNGNHTHEPGVLVCTLCTPEQP